jgi:hypothetical protein
MHERPYDDGVNPGIVIGLGSLLILILAALALAKEWSRIFMMSGIIAQFLNVLIAHAFAKLPAVHRKAPTGGKAVVGSAGLAFLAHYGRGWGCGPAFPVSSQLAPPDA